MRLGENLKKHCPVGLNIGLSSFDWVYGVLLDQEEKLIKGE